MFCRPFCFLFKCFRLFPSFFFSVCVRRVSSTLTWSSSQVVDVVVVVVAGGGGVIPIWRCVSFHAHFFRLSTGGPTNFPLPSRCRCRCRYRSTRGRTGRQDWPSAGLSFIPCFISHVEGIVAPVVVLASHPTSHIPCFEPPVAFHLPIETMQPCDAMLCHAPNERTNGRTLSFFFFAPYACDTTWHRPRK